MVLYLQMPGVRLGVELEGGREGEVGYGEKRTREGKIRELNSH